MSVVKPPFAYFGGKSTVTPVIWERFGSVYNYVEPFFGSGSVLLGRPHPAQHEVVNDIDCNLVNFWRAVRFDHQFVARTVDHPISEIDFNARKKVIRSQQKRLKNLLESSPESYDSKLAGYWIWCVNLAIGGTPAILTRMHTKPVAQGHGLLGRTQNKFTWLELLHDRLVNVRVYCGQWSRVVTPAMLWPSTHPELPVGIFMDPPYDDEKVSRQLYVEHRDSVADGAREWAIKNGCNPSLRICLASYDNLTMPSDWECVRWSTRGGLANLKGATELDRVATRSRECLWFSPHCLKPSQQLTLGVL